MATRKTKTDNPKFYDLKAILSKNADYNVISAKGLTARLMQP